MTVFEVRVKVRQPQQRYKVRLYHIPATKQKSAIKRAKKYGEPLEARKMPLGVASGEIENLKRRILSPVLAMSEMPWRKKNGRKRRGNLHKDKTV